MLLIVPSGFIRLKLFILNQWLSKYHYAYNAKAFFTIKIIVAVLWQLECEYLVTDLSLILVTSESVNVRDPGFDYRVGQKVVTFSI